MRVRVIADHSPPGYYHYMKLIEQDGQAVWQVTTPSGATGWVDASLTRAELIEVRDKLAADVAADEARRQTALPPPH